MRDNKRFTIHNVPDPGTVGQFKQCVSISIHDMDDDRVSITLGYQGEDDDDPIFNWMFVHKDDLRVKRIQNFVFDPTCGPNPPVHMSPFLGGVIGWHADLDKTEEVDDERA